MLVVGIEARLGNDFFLDEEVPRHEWRKRYMVVTEKSLMWRQGRSTIFTFQGLTPNKAKRYG